jgi:hypothetical protein
MNYSFTKELVFFWSINAICKLARDQNYIIFVFLHRLLKKLHQIIILLHVFLIILFIYSLSFVFHLVCNWFMFSLCTIAFEVHWFLVISYTIICGLTSMICFVCQYCLDWSHAFLCKGKKGKFRNIKIKRNSFHNFGNYCDKLARIIQDFRKPCALKECNQILDPYGF